MGSLFAIAINFGGSSVLLDFEQVLTWEFPQDSSGPSDEDDNARTDQPTPTTIYHSQYAAFARACDFS